MISRMAMDEVRDMLAEGLQLTPEQICEINDAGSRVERSPAAALSAPDRVAWAGATAIHEPTVQVEEWMDEVAARVAADDDTYWSLLLFACAHAREEGFFSQLTTPREVMRAVTAWRRTLTATRRQLTAALMYAVLGDGPAAPKNAETKAVDPTADPALRAAVAARLGIPLAELRRQTHRRLIDWATAAMVADGGELRKSDRTALADYYRTCDRVWSEAARKQEVDADGGQN